MRPTARQMWMAALTAGALMAFASAARTATKVATILVDNLAFGAAPAALRVGDTVEWVNRDPFLHSVTDPARRLELSLPPGGRARLVLSRAGVIAYYCRYHPGMKGRIDVRP